ncbi:hypothetical protein EXS72_00905 [Candidatus Pacearchaeota archaeon]|nr:hypothetical protein [Candidatus Pacearchaeota archaeon]
MTASNHKKIVLGVHTRRTKWAPVWAVVKRFGKGKRVHPSAMTAIRRHWRRSKIKVKPRRTSKKHLG